MQHGLGVRQRQRVWAVEVEAVAPRKRRDLKAKFELAQRAARDIAETCDQQPLHASILCVRSRFNRADTSSRSTRANPCSRRHCARTWCCPTAAATAPAAAARAGSSKARST